MSAVCPASHPCPRLVSAGRQQRGTHGGGGLGGVRLSPPSQRHHQPQGHRLHRCVAHTASGCDRKAAFAHCFHGQLIQNPFSVSLASVRSAGPSAASITSALGQLRQLMLFFPPVAASPVTPWLCSWSAVPVRSCHLRNDFLDFVLLL